ncbi:YjjG family noncanonical pyrimidine nucleotidase [Alkalibacterium sp. f15]|uniref:YjjG family noncanonical pyrimidine nucleotidase n=1 Tax=Alkalibacterium sp. f15 TaxID=3414029 RepID=UPI003BF7C755
MKYKKIIFDLDNTVLDFRDTEEKALKKVIDAYDLPYTDETIAMYKEINHGLWQKLEQGIISREMLFSSRFALFLEGFGLNVDGNTVEDLYRQNLGQGYKKMDHAHELLTALKKNGYHIYAGTNGVAKTQWQRLAGAELMHFFEEVFISEEIGVEKPDPQFFTHIFDTLKTDNKAEFLMVGDSLTSDIQGAKNAGIDSVWYNFSEKPVDSEAVESTFSISNLLELLTLFGIEREKSALHLDHLD